MCSVDELTSVLAARCTWWFERVRPLLHVFFLFEPRVHPPRGSLNFRSRLLESHTWFGLLLVVIVPTK